ncbi:MAG: HEPN domain-containing protein [Candidatus Altiarchaeota archaeon]|nr:HEPN domain-containing protein [Candidatus Altiarchaeota archaeon]
MKDSELLRKAAKAHQLEVVAPSENVFKSYTRKSGDCLKSAEILAGNGLYDNSISEAYYAIYDSLTALLRKTGVKCENHAVSIVLLEVLFGEKPLRDIATWARDKRIDSQYYVDSHSNQTLSSEMISKAENFLGRVESIARRMTSEQADAMRTKLLEILK